MLENRQVVIGFPHVAVTAQVTKQDRLGLVVESSVASKEEI